MSLRWALIVVLAVADGSQVRVTPIEKVTQLLKGLEAKITAEGKKEAAAYDKYACFCKEQADEKLYAIEKSDKTIEKLSAEIKELDAAISELNGQIGTLNSKASGLEDKIKDNQDDRDADHAAYLAKAKDLIDATEACGAAIAAMKDAKGGLKDAKVNLVQVHSRLMAAAAKHSVPAKAMALIESLGAPKYQFQGNDIIATLEDLKATFNQMKKELDEDEFDVNSVHEKEALGDSNNLKFTKKERDEKAALVEKKSEEVMQARESREEENKDRSADQSFLDTVTRDCEDKAANFDQRSRTRSDELTAMTGAIQQLEEGVKPNAGASKKLVGLVQGAPSFIQIRNQAHTLQQDSNRAVKRVQELLQEAAGRLDSKVLQGAAARVQLSADHFVKVRGLIKDLITKLEKDAAAEADQKSFCDKAMSDAIQQRDDGKSDQEAAQAQLTKLRATKEELENDIADLAAEIAANKKALNEASQLRNQEKADNEQTLAEAEEGEEAVKMALQILGDFYDNAFVQTSKKYVPPNSDRDGNTVGDLAPKTESEPYHGAQDEAKGIVGIMEVIQSDFARTISTVEEEERVADEKFVALEKETNGDIKTMDESSTKKDGELKDTKGSLLEEEQALKDATDLNEAGMEKLDNLKADCVEGEETWQERADARKKEVEALKEAQNVLDEWQN
jgi:hypothetical protein